ncbi:MAG: helix-hairpin-helix domain-containing protein [Syntrophaceae bacterium]|nr:helix-hairpin-helix domain-containing protein [Syntrophaceae bacterium]
MTISESKLKGIIAFCFMLAIIPFIGLLSQYIVKDKIPAFANQGSHYETVEIVENKKSAGIYFVPQGTSVNQLLQSVGMKQKSKNDPEIKSGMKIEVHPAWVNRGIIIKEISNAEKISVGLALDINKASKEDLILIKGIGPATAQKIVELRKKVNGIKNIKQLMEIKGMKEKRIKQIEKYLYVKH